MKIIIPFKEGESYLTQGFGLNKNLYSKWGLDGHNGLDFGTNKKPTDTISVFNGKVKLGTTGPYGNNIKVYSDDGKYYAMYAHLSEFNVTDGQLVSIGDVLGKTGNTGNSFGIHLHFAIYEIDSNGNKININNGFFGSLHMDLKKDGVYINPTSMMIDYIDDDRSPYEKWMDNPNRDIAGLAFVLIEAYGPITAYKEGEQFFLKNDKYKWSLDDSLNAKKEEL